MSATDQAEYFEAEERISDARGIFAAIFDEDLPEIVGDRAVRDSVKDRTLKGMELLDSASAHLEKVEGQRDSAAFSLDEAQSEVDSLKEELEAMDISLLAQRLSFELAGRRMTNSPTEVLNWITAALRDLSGRTELDYDTVEIATTNALRLEAV